MFHIYLPSSLSLCLLEIIRVFVVVVLFHLLLIFVICDYQQRESKFENSFSDHLISTHISFHVCFDASILEFFLAPRQTRID